MNELFQVVPDIAVLCTMLLHNTRRINKSLVVGVYVVARILFSFFSLLPPFRSDTESPVRWIFYEFQSRFQSESINPYVMYWMEKALKY